MFTLDTDLRAIGLKKTASDYFSQKRFCIEMCVFELVWSIQFVDCINHALDIKPHENADAFYLSDEEIKIGNRRKAFVSTQGVDGIDHLFNLVFKED